MAESPVFDRAAAPAALCPRCGRLFEISLEIPGPDGTSIRLRGHVQGDPATCIPLPGLASIRGDGRDARRRKATRRAT